MQVSRSEPPLVASGSSVVLAPPIEPFRLAGGTVAGRQLSAVEEWLYPCIEAQMADLVPLNGKPYMDALLEKHTKNMAIPAYRQLAEYCEFARRHLKEAVSQQEAANQLMERASSVLKDEPTHLDAVKEMLMRFYAFDTLRYVPLCETPNRVCWKVHGPPRFLSEQKRALLFMSVIGCVGTMVTLALTFSAVSSRGNGETITLLGIKATAVSADAFSLPTAIVFGVLSVIGIGFTAFFLFKLLRDKSKPVSIDGIRWEMYQKFVGFLTKESNRNVAGDPSQVRRQEL